MLSKTKKLIIDIFITTLILGVSFGVSMLFQKFEVKAILGFINDKLWFVEELNLYVINFFNYIFHALLRV